MLLSICLITRNAEEQIARVLQSVAGLGAEVVVADTGSTDDTVGTARAFGAEGLAIAWQDDFGAAQNQAMARTTGDWILWLNPDEELGPEGRDQLAELLERPDALAYELGVRVMMKADATATGIETVQPRLLRRHAELQFVGRLHPHFVVPLHELARRENRRIYPCDLVIRHHSYLSVLTPEKIRWANRLLELELLDRPGQLHYQIEYGRNLLRLNDPKGHLVLAEAADQVLAGKEALAAPSPTVGSLLEYLLTVSAEQSRGRISFAEVRELALRWFPLTPPLLWVLAKRAFQAEAFEEAVTHLERLVHCGRTGIFDRSAAFDPTIIAEPAVLNLGRCYARLGELDRAEACFRQLLTSPPHLKEASDGITLVQTLRQSAPARPNRADHAGT